MESVETEAKRKIRGGWLVLERRKKESSELRYFLNSNGQQLLLVPTSRTMKYFFLEKDEDHVVTFL
jgi:hypothetical protein